MDIERLRKIRIERGLKQEEVAEKMKTSQGAIGKYERGELDLNTEKLKRICEIYNISADYLLGLPKGLPYPD